MLYDVIEEHNQQRTVTPIQVNPSQIYIRASVINSNSIQIAIADNEPGTSEYVQKQIFNVTKGTKFVVELPIQQNKSKCKKPKVKRKTF
ncbi:phosphatase [Fischerella thermalis CCMEE 5330]|uniref:Phosphatase n=1 Tax=Fischerella thermalis CCMEE 5330 TaxID=2019670 RepID=A0A2N6MBR7_9CYAN|nr:MULTISPECIES: hypothetical protein [Fischerella]PMB44219.1 phosphatase [Fischerella thermalis CCMEE 5330]BAU05655.1 integral membrane sensor signal transduction histidine kinase [Fischerella sp. NIES-3754]BCX07924.1 MAG: hypothetical protein KatS3mg066_1783 [Fischerella sp.]